MSHAEIDRDTQGDYDKKTLKKILLKALLFYFFLFFLSYRMKQCTLYIKYT